MLIIVFVETQTDIFDLCSSTNNSSDIESYNWKRQSIENCGCKHCIRKCCKPGYYYKRINFSTALCLRRNQSSFRVPVYEDGTTYVKDVRDTTSFMVGPINCVYYALKNRDFYIQADGTVWVSKFSKFIYNDDKYCIEEVENTDLNILLCVPPKYVSINVIGMYFFLKKFPIY